MSVISRMIGDKRRWRAYRARVKQLPENYRAAVLAIERYVMYFGPSDGGQAATMYEDLAELFEQAVADGTPIRAIVGEDPVEFAEAFVANYSGGGWISQQQDRLKRAIDDSTKEGESE